MKRLMLVAVVTAICGACFVAGQISAEEEKGGAFPIPDWMQKGTEHEALKRSVGDWNVAQKIWMMPGQPPMEAKATASGSLLWGGRFLEIEFKGDFMGTPFDGRLLMGFDRVDTEYVGVWIDSMSTYLSVSRGKEKDGVITFEMNDPDWQTGKKKVTHMLMKWIDDDTYTLTFVDPSGEGEPRTTMEMTYTRK